MADRSTRLRLGDVVELVCEPGFAYVQYRAAHPRLRSAQLVRGLDAYSKVRLSIDDLVEIVRRPERWVIWTPLALAVREGTVNVIGNLPLPPGATGVPLMKSLSLGPDGTILARAVIDPRTRSKEALSEFTSEQRQLSPDVIIGIPDVIDLFRSDWRPEMFEDRHLVGPVELERRPPPTSPIRTHFITAADQATAEALANDLRARNFEAVTRADGSAWAVEVTEQHTYADIGHSAEIERLALAHGANYGGDVVGPL